MWLAYGAADRGRTYSYLQQFHCVLAGNAELDGAADRGGTYSYLNIFITAIFTVSVTEGPTAPGVGAFDSADGPADRGGVLLHLARPVRLIVRVSNPNFHNGDFYGLGNRRPHGAGGGCVRLGRRSR